MRFFNLMLDKIVDTNLTIGKQLVLENKKLTCVDIIENNGDKLYVFNNGSRFTKSNIINDIGECQHNKKEWKIG